MPGSSSATDNRSSPGSSTRPGGCWPTPEVCLVRPGRPSATRSCSNTWRARAASTRRWRSPCAARGDSLGGSGPGSAATRASVGCGWTIRPSWSSRWRPSSESAHDGMPSGTPGRPGRLSPGMRLTKHQGLGNDFLVLLDDASHPLDARIARALCDRRTGVGADGIIRATPFDAVPDDAADAVAAMELRNADGSAAEMSGNGIRCLAQALVLAGWAAGPTITIRTDAGLRTVTLHRSDPLTYDLSVDMGSARIDGEAPEWAAGPIRRTLRVDLGNPHLLLEVGPDGEEPDLVELGEQVNAKVPGGVNVHLVTSRDRRHIAIRSYERGVGPTLACGTDRTGFPREDRPRRRQRPARDHGGDRGVGGRAGAADRYRRCRRGGPHLPAAASARSAHLRGEGQGGRAARGGREH